MSLAVSPESPRRRPIIPLVLIVIGVAMYFAGWLIVYAPNVVPMMVLIQATMFGPLLCAVLLAVWFVLRPLASWLFAKQREPAPVAPSASAFAPAGHDAGSTDVKAPGHVMASTQPAYTLESDAPPPRRGSIVPTLLIMAGRLGIVALLIGACVGLVALAEKETRFFFTIWGIPAALAFLTAALVLLLRAPLGARVVTAGLLFLATAAPWELIRMEGVTGTFGLDPAWRWSQTAEERVAQFEDKSDPASVKPIDDKALTMGEGDYPGFRGADRAGRAPALKNTELVKQWDRPIGPGWGSVSGVGELLFTQEQRKDNEVVTCYDLATGKLRWVHGEETRHSDGPSGPGPRATPTFAGGKLYTFGGTGLLLRLDARTGKREWKTEVKEVLDVKNPVFGFACSPLVHKGKVYLHPGVEGPILAAFDADSGKRLWTAGHQKNESYSSPQLSTLAGVEQILVFGSTGVNSYDPETGKDLWEYAWASEPTAQPSVQPTVLPGDRVVMGGAQPSTGFRCLKVSKSGDSWTAEQEWETKAVSPRFNDVVFYDNHLFGLDSGRLFCLDASNGELRWKSRSAAFGSGQVMLVGKKIVVLAEKGYLSLFDADVNSAPKPERVEALTDKTWNHPAVVGGRLIVRNGKEMICFAPKE